MCSAKFVPKTENKIILKVFGLFLRLNKNKFDSIGRRQVF